MDPECIFRGLPVVLKDASHAEILRESIQPQTLCDMIQNSIPCPKGSPGKPFRRDAIRVCANRKGRIFSIILEKDHTIRIGKEAYAVIHVKPI
jgi:hypothetical protein